MIMHIYYSEHYMNTTSYSKKARCGFAHKRCERNCSIAAKGGNVVCLTSSMIPVQRSHALLASRSGIMATYPCYECESCTLSCCTNIQRVTPRWTAARLQNVNCTLYDTAARWNNTYRFLCTAFVPGWSLSFMTWTCVFCSVRKACATAKGSVSLLPDLRMFLTTHRLCRVLFLVKGMLLLRYLHSWK